MTEPLPLVSDATLREIAESSSLALAICASMGEPSWRDIRSIAAELVEARAEVERLRAENSALRHDVADAMPFLPAGRGSLKDAAMDLEMERDEARKELAAVDEAISDRGIAERDCTLPLPERVSNIITELKEWRHEAGEALMQVEDLSDMLRFAKAELERLWADQANLRRALIASGKAVGCVLSDAVSDEFLMGVPQEVLACVAKLRSDVDCHSLNHDSALDLLDKERAEVERLRARLAALERVREEVGGYAQFRKDWEASVRTLKPQEAEQHFTEWAYQDAARMARVLCSLDAAKESGHD